MIKYLFDIVLFYNDKIPVWHCGGFFHPHSHCQDSHFPVSLSQSSGPFKQWHVFSQLVPYLSSGQAAKINIMLFMSSYRLYLILYYLTPKCWNRKHHFTKQKTSLTLPLLFIKVSVPSPESVLSCICGLGVSILPLFYDFFIGFWNCVDSLVFFFSFDYNILQTLQKL